MRTALVFLTTTLAAAPASIVLTLVLLPAWSWLEATAGIESVGHSGPAEWCYVAVFVLLVSCASLIIFRRRKKSFIRPER